MPSPYLLLLLLQPLLLLLLSAASGHVMLPSRGPTGASQRGLLRPLGPQLGGFQGPPLAFVAPKDPKESEETPERPNGDNQQQQPQHKQQDSSRSEAPPAASAAAAAGPGAAAAAEDPLVLVESLFVSGSQVLSARDISRLSRGALAAYGAPRGPGFVLSRSGLSGACIKFKEEIQRLYAEKGYLLATIEQQQQQQQEQQEKGDTEQQQQQEKGDIEQQQQQKGDTEQQQQQKGDTEQQQQQKGDTEQQQQQQQEQQQQEQQQQQFLSVEFKAKEPLLGPVPLAVEFLSDATDTLQQQQQQQQKPAAAAAAEAGRTRVETLRKFLGLEAGAPFRWDAERWTAIMRSGKP